VLGLNWEARRVRRVRREHGRACGVAEQCWGRCAAPCNCVLVEVGRRVSTRLRVELRSSHPMVVRRNGDTILPDLRIAHNVTLWFACRTYVKATMGVETTTDRTTQVASRTTATRPAGFCKKKHRDLSESMALPLVQNPVVIAGGCYTR
jgi:hypothetical protein